MTELSFGRRIYDAAVEDVLALEANHPAAAELAPLDRVLSLFWVTPNVHKIHHSRLVSETNSNYANILTIYDRLFGTFTPADRAEKVVYGLDDDRNLGEASLTGLVAIPFQRPETADVPDRKVRVEAHAGR